MKTNKSSFDCNFSQQDKSTFWYIFNKKKLFFIFYISEILIFWVTVTQNICLFSDSHSKCVSFKWQSPKMYVFWVTVTQNVCLLSDSHSKCMSFEWQSLKMYVFLGTVTQNVCLLSDSHSKCISLSFNCKINVLERFTKMKSSMFWIIHIM